MSFEQCQCHPNIIQVASESYGMVTQYLDQYLKRSHHIPHCLNYL